MNILRISDSVVANNAWLVTLAVVAVLIAGWVGLVGGAFAIRWLAQQTGVKAVEKLTDRLVAVARTIAIVASCLVFVGAIALLAYGVWQERDFYAQFADYATELTPASLWSLAKTALALLGLLALFFSLYRATRAALPKLQSRLLKLSLLAPHADELADLFKSLPQPLTLAVFYFAAHPVLGTLAVPASGAWFVTTVLYVALILSTARLVVGVGWLALAVLDTYVAGITSEDYYQRFSRLLPLARRTVEAITYLAATTLIVRRFEALEWFVPYGKIIIELISVFFVSRLGIDLVSVLIDKVMLRGDFEVEETRQRRLTLSVMVQALAMYVIYFGMGLTMLIVVGIDPTPILAGAGILGLAVGLGSQKIVGDVVSGFFMLFEDQMLLGDYIKINDTEGVVEQLYLRVTRIRDRFGRVHTLRNGDIQNVINYSRGWTLAVVEMNVAYEADLTKVFEVMKGVGERLAQELPEQLFGPAEIVGLEALDESCLRVRTETKVKPGCHFEVKRVLNRLLFEAFRDNKLEIPYPKSIEFAEPPPP